MQRTHRGWGARLDAPGMAGVALLVVGVAVFLYVNQEITELEGIVGTVGRALDPDRRQYYDTLKIVRIVAGVAVVLGVVGLAVDLGSD